MSVLNFEFFKKNLFEFESQFKQSNPIKYLVIDNVILSSNDLFQFPDFSWNGWNEFNDKYQFSKRTCNNIELIPDKLKQIILEGNSPLFLKLLENITGIQKLIPDPYLNGGGLHSSGPGGNLSMHTDFHVYNDLDLFRRLNVIIYFNKDWRSGDGGELLLDHKKNRTEGITIEPLYGRMVVFETNDISLHGFKSKVTEGCRRDSIALYYYTSTRPVDYSGDMSTHWTEDHISNSVWYNLRKSLYKIFMFTSRVFSKIARLVDNK